MWSFIYTILGFMLLHHTDCQKVAISGPCYSRAQIQCEHHMAQFWSALIHNDVTKICLNLQSIQVCMEGAMSICRFKQHEMELYEKDMISIYTKPPYSCSLQQNEMKMKFNQDGPSSIASRVGVLPWFYFTAMMTLVLHTL